MKNIKVGVSYGEFPLFCSDDDEMTYFSPSELRTPVSLINDWDRNFQLTYNEEFISKSGFKSREDEEEHNRIGLELASKIQAYVGEETNIEFMPGNGARLTS